MVAEFGQPSSSYYDFEFTISGVLPLPTQSNFAEITNGVLQISQVTQELTENVVISFSLTISGDSKAMSLTVNPSVLPQF